MNSTIVSVIMSTYNENIEELTSSIDSILNQSFKEFEFIIINDNPENSKLKEILTKYKLKDPRICILENKINMGLTKSLNLGLDNSRGKYIARMDADDISDPYRLEKQLKYLESNNDIFLLGTSAIIIDEGNNKTGYFNAIKDSNKLASALTTNNSLFHSTIMFRNGILRYRSKMQYVEDYDLYLRILSEGKKIANLGEYLVKYRIRSNSITSQNAGKQRIMKELAKTFYLQRKQTGTDGYVYLDLNKILSSDEIRKNKFYMQGEIYNSYRKNDLVEMRKHCLSLLKNQKNRELKYILLFSILSLPNVLKNNIFRLIRNRN